MTRNNPNRQDVYTRITNTIVAELEKGIRPWVKPWSAENAIGKITRPLRHNGQAYSGINILMLWASAMEAGYAMPMWMTFRQAKELGATVRKGEKGSLVVYANTLTRVEENEEGDPVAQEIPFMKGYTVFNVEQIDGLPDLYYSKPAPRTDAPERINHADAYFAATKATLRHGGNRAYYNVMQDFVQMPYFETFRDPESYYATLAHEMTHWTRHNTRLDRDFGRKRWGDEGYAMEELVAELGAAFLCADLELTPEVRDDHAAYIASWLKVLKENKRAIFTAAAHAQRAADFLSGLQESTSTRAVA